MTHARVITLELAERFAAELLSNSSHSVESAACVVKLRGDTVRAAIARFEKNECTTELDDLIGEILTAAKCRHAWELRKKGDKAADDKNAPGVAWYRWRLETQAPKEHPRGVQAADVPATSGVPLHVPLSREEAIEGFVKFVRANPDIYDRIVRLEH